MLIKKSKVVVKAWAIFLTLGTILNIQPSFGLDKSLEPTSSTRPSGEWTGHQLVEKILGHRVAKGKVVLGSSYRARYTAFTLNQVRYIVLRDGRVLTLANLSTVVFCGPDNSFHDIDLIVTTKGERIPRRYIYAIVRR